MMFILFLPLLSVLISINGAFINTQIPPDCDEEMASLGTGLVQARMDDPGVLQRINAILSSCNKSPMQKMTEVSVYLLDKGTFQSQTMKELYILQNNMKEEKKKQFEAMKEHLSDNLKHAVDILASIGTNSSLSGNERVDAMHAQLLLLPPADRSRLHALLSRPSLFDVPLNMPGTPITATRTTIGERKHITPDPPQEKNTIDHPSFPILKETMFASEKRKTLNMIPVMAVPTSEGRGEVIFDDAPVGAAALGAPPSQGAAAQKSPLEIYNSITQQIDPVIRKEVFSQEPYVRNDVIPPTLYNRNDPGGRYIDMMTKNRRVEQPPVTPVVYANGRPSSVGTTASKGQIDDADLMNPRSSLWTEAARLLENPGGLPAHLTKWIQDAVKTPAQPTIPHGVHQQRFDAMHTFPLPEEAYQKRSHPENPQLLPSRDAIVPVNFPRDLERFETNTGRFDKGSNNANRVVLSGVVTEQLLKASLPTRDNVNIPNQSNQHLLPVKDKEEPKYTSYPDHRSGLFPLHENHARESVYQKTATPLNNGQAAVYKNINDQVEGVPSNIPIQDLTRFSQDKTVVLESFPPGPYPKPAPPRQRAGIDVVGADLLDLDPRGSIPMGRYGIEYPTYPLAPYKNPTTTVIAIIEEPNNAALEKLNVRAPEVAVLERPPAVTNPPFRPYSAPEEITGSHLTPDIYNVRHHGQHRFVKIDLLNE